MNPDPSGTGGASPPELSAQRDSHPAHPRHPFVTGLAVLLLVAAAVLFASGVGFFGRNVPRATDSGVSTSSPSTEQFRQALEGAAQILPASPTDLFEILRRLLLAALLGGLIAFRGTRRHNEFMIVHTNVIIAFTGAMMMIIVGSDLARAFGLVGASSIIRYRTPVSDPKALASLFVSMGAGIAVGVGLYELAIVGAVLVILIEFLLERVGPLVSRGWYRPERSYELSIETDKPVETLKALRDIFESSSVSHMLMNYDRGKKENVEMGLTVGIPTRADLEKLTLQILGAGARSVSWRVAKD